MRLASMLLMLVGLAGCERQSGASGATPGAKAGAITVTKQAGAVVGADQGVQAGETKKY